MWFGYPALDIIYMQGFKTVDISELPRKDSDPNLNPFNII